MPKYLEIKFHKKSGNPSSTPFPGNPLSPPFPDLNDFITPPSPPVS